MWVGVGFSANWIPVFARVLDGGATSLELEGLQFGRSLHDALEGVLVCSGVIVVFQGLLTLKAPVTGLALKPPLFDPLSAALCSGSKDLVLVYRGSGVLRLGDLDLAGGLVLGTFPGTPVLTGDEYVLLSTLGACFSNKGKDIRVDVEVLDIGLADREV